MPDDDPIIRCEIVSGTLEDLRVFISELDEIDLGCRPVARRHANGYSIDAYLLQSQLEKSRSLRSAANVEINEVENATEASRARQSEVGTDNRYDQRSALPHGLGVKE